MKLSEIIALAKAGYKKSDIEDLLSIEVDEPEPDPVSTEPEPGSEGDPEPSPEPSEDPDYKQMYDSLQSEFDKIKEDLRIAQENNKRSPAPDPKDEYDLGEVLRGYM